MSSTSHSEKSLFGGVQRNSSVQCQAFRKKKIIIITDGESDREVSQKECCDTLVLADKQKKKKILTNKQN